MADEKVNLGRSAGIVSIATALSRVSGLISILFIAYALGPTRLQDSYNLANVMPNMIYELIAGGILTSILIPIFISGRLKNETDGWRSVSNIANLTVLILVTIAIMGTIFSFYFVRVQTFLVPTQEVSVERLSFFFKFFVWEIVFYGITAILNGILQSYRKFTMPALAPIFNNILVIVTIAFFYLPLRDSNPDLALIYLAAGTTLGIAAMALVQLPALLKVGWRYTFVLDFRDPALRQLAILALPVVAYVASNQIALTVSNALAWKFKGGMTAFTYAWRFFQMPYGLLAAAISTVLFPNFAEYAALSNMKEFKKTLSRAFTTTGFIIIPATVALFILSLPIIIFIFVRVLGNFTVSDATQIAGVMAYLMAGLLPYSMFMLLNRVFYSLKDTLTPMKVNAVGVPLNIGLNFFLVGYFGVAGLAMGHSLTYLFTMSVLLIMLRKRIGPLNGRETMKKILLFALISGVMGIIMIAVTKIIPSLSISGKSVELAIITVSLSLGGIFYMLLNKALGTEEEKVLTKLTKSIFNRQ